MTTDTTTRCAGSDVLLASLNPNLPDLAGRMHYLRQSTGMVFCPECDDLVDTRSSFCDLRVAEHGRPLCDWTDADECAMAAERAVAGTDAQPAACVVHGGAR